MAGWIGVDLDGTLAYFDHWRGNEHIGEPIPLMAARVRAWLEQGIEVRIMTARVGPHGAAYDDGTPIDPFFVPKARRAIERWCEKHFGRKLPVTCEKDFQMIEIWDDRAVQVVPNNGLRVDTLTRVERAG